MAIQDDSFASLFGFSSNAIEGGFIDLRNQRVLLITSSGATFSVPLVASQLESLGDVIVGGDVDALGDLFANSAELDVQLTVDTSSNSSAVITLAADRTVSNVLVGQVRAEWNGTLTGRAIFFTGADAVNKDEGYFRIDIASAGGAIISPLYVGTSTTTDVVVNLARLPNVNFQVRGDTAVDLIKTDSPTDRVGINTGTPTETLHVNGNTKTDTIVYTAVTAASAPNSSTFVDSADGGLKYKSPVGTVTTIVAGP